ncbi:serine/threonine-protein phosphatase [Sphingomonas parva]|uniref:Serine/threonine-protein phosphatase n=1 Tax=Sphingomonas parva TaxID=2555898 RepID=A0A4Y8ZS48_9SPHN|nr:protein phosphatase 2C domain-containing protein [Sphingomonas parva]TFI57619.1 serine/threonine-protein phosphatase [Sphingomonas parva]
MIPLKTEWHALTDVGAVRKLNEDRYLASDALGLWAVADGMGGMAHGDWAAATAIEALGGLQRCDGLEETLASVASALRGANEQLLAEAELRGQQLGTTAVVLAIRDLQYGLLWVGDSRAYLIRDGQLRRLTRDHSQVQELVDRGLLDADGAARHPLRNVLTRALGVSTPLELDRIEGRLEPDDLLLLCSDGLHGVVDDAEMQTILDRERLDEALPTLVRRCHELGAPDNITVIAISVSESTLIQFAAIDAGVGI